VPVMTENCPGCFEAPKERARIKMVLAQQEQVQFDITPTSVLMTEIDL
jgi:hypothetical protein